MRTKTGCLTCRLRHLKCDEVRPVCDRCRRGKRECVLVEPGVNFRYIFCPLQSHNHRHDQVNPAGTTRRRRAGFGRYHHVLETTDIVSSQLQIRHYESGNIPAAEDSAAAVFHDQETPSVQEETPLCSLTEDQSPYPLQHASPQRSPGHSTEGSLSQTVLESASTIAGALRLEKNPDTPETPICPTAGESRILLYHDQALLMRFFKEQWASALDSQDYAHHFTLEVPQLALKTPVLLNAIFAVASLHQSRLSASSFAVAEQYHGECVKLILPMLDQAEKPMSDVLLATTVILRVYEQMNGSFEDNECHLLGASALASSYTSTRGSLWEAAFWVYLRQDIYMAIICQRPIKIDLSDCWLWRETSPSNDAEWSQLIMVIVADIVGFCFSKAEVSIEKWQALQDQIDEWNRRRPSTFAPYYFAERDVDVRRYFPEIYLLEQWHVTANIYYHMGQALILMYDPNPTVGMQARRHQKLLEAHMIHHARTICGICLSNPTSETRRTACYAINLCCPYICDPKEQETILQILKEIESKDAWPTSDTAQVLLDEWGFARDL